MEKLPENIIDNIYRMKHELEFRETIERLNCICTTCLAPVYGRSNICTTCFNNQFYNQNFYLLRYFFISYYNL